MKNGKRQHTSEFKSRAVLEMLRGELTVSELAGKYEVHPTQLHKWKKHLLDSMPEIFGQKREKVEKDDEELKAELYQQIGKLKVEVDWLKKKVGF